MGLLQIDTFYLDTLSNNSVNINGRHCMKHGNRQSTDALQQLSPAVGLRPGLGKVKVTVFRVTASSLSTPHTAHCALPLLAATHQLCSFSIVSRWSIATSALSRHTAAQLLQYTQTLTNTLTHFDHWSIFGFSKTFNINKVSSNSKFLLTRY